MRAVLQNRNLLEDLLEDLFGNILKKKTDELNLIQAKNQITKRYCALKEKAAKKGTSEGWDPQQNYPISKRC